MTDPKTVLDLTSIAHLHIPTGLCPTFSLDEPESIFTTLETVIEMLVQCLSGVSVAEINSFPVSSSLVSLPLDFVVVSGQTWSV